MSTLLRYTLGILIAIVALNAFVGGYYGLSGAEDVPTEWLEGSPFRDYVIPSLILIFVVGGSCTVAAAAVLLRTRYAQRLAILCGSIILCWVFVQLAIIGYVSWMQPAIALVGIAIITLAWYLPKY